MKINWHSLGAGALAIFGVLAQNTAQLPAHVAQVVTLAAILVATFSKKAVQAQ